MASRSLRAERGTMRRRGLAFEGVMGRREEVDGVGEREASSLRLPGGLATFGEPYAAGYPQQCQWRCSPRIRGLDVHCKIGWTASHEVRSVPLPPLHAVGTAKSAGETTGDGWIQRGIPETRESRRLLVGEAMLDEGGSNAAAVKLPWSQHAACP
jgi:hypothetical protein